MILFIWVIILIGAIGFGLVGVIELIKAAVDFNKVIAIRHSITLFWGYGFAQIGIRELLGEHLSSIRIKPE